MKYVCVNCFEVFEANSKIPGNVFCSQGCSEEYSRKMKEPKKVWREVSPGKWEIEIGN